MLGPIAAEKPALKIERARGIYLWDLQGRRYIDLTSGLLVNLVGHRNPVILRAVRKQLRRHLHVMVYGVWPQPIQEKFSRILLSTFPPDYETVYPTCTGTEAVETALRFAFALTGRSQFIAFEGAYHGETQGSLNMIGPDTYRSVFGWTQARVLHLPWNDIDSLDRISDDTAGILFEPVQGEAGIRPARRRFLDTLFKRARSSGALVIADEVQTGLGRCGRWWSGIGPWGSPDIIVTGKALGGGFPLAGVVLKKGFSEHILKKGVIPHLTTFGGHPISCAAGMASLQWLKKRNAPRLMKRRGRWIKTRLLKLRDRHPEKIRKIRGIGYMWGIELNDEHTSHRLEQQLAEQGFLVDRPLFAPRVLRLAPPLITPKSVLNTFFLILDSILTTT